VGNLKAREHFEDTGIDERKIVNGSERKRVGGHGLIDLVLDRDKWQVLGSKE
jgi:hypothetical protein